jgi:hypothetical protein
MGNYREANYRRPVRDAREVISQNLDRVRTSR